MNMQIAALLLVLACAAMSVQGVNPPSPDVWFASWGTTEGAFIVQYNRTWAPIGVDQQYALIKAGFYNNNGFFRMVPGFVDQWGISGVPAENKQWSQPIKDDPVFVSNTQWTITYADAGPNTRTTQLFVNLVDNASLDSQGFAPVGFVLANTTDVFASLFSGYGQRPSQQAITNQGNAYLQKNFPKLSYTTTVEVTVEIRHKA